MREGHSHLFEMAVSFLIVNSLKAGRNLVQKAFSALYDGGTSGNIDIRRRLWQILHILVPAAISDTRLENTKGDPDQRHRYQENNTAGKQQAGNQCGKRYRKQNGCDDFSRSPSELQGNANHFEGQPAKQNKCDHLKHRYTP